MKKITLLLSFMIFINGFSQDLSKDIQLDQNNPVDSYGFNKDGFFYLKYNKRESELPEDKIGTVELYNTIFEKVYKYDVPKNFVVSEITRNGSQIKSKNLRLNSYTPDYIFLNEEGDIQNYKSTGYKTFKFKPKGFILLYDFIKKNNLYLVGYYKVSKKVSPSKRKYQIIKRDLKSEETKEIDFNISEELTSNETLLVELLHEYNSDNKISFLSKIFKEDESLGSNFEVLKSKNQTYRILNYDENLKLINKADFNVEKFSEKLNFCNSNTSTNSFSTGSDDKLRTSLSQGQQQWSNKSYTVYNANPTASGNIIKAEDGFYYTYSSLTSARGIKESKKKKGGILVNKFDSKGVLVWKKYIEITKEKMSAYGPYVYLDFNVTKDNIVIAYTNLFYSDRYNLVSVLSKDSGEVTSQKSFSRLKFDKPKGDGNKRKLTVKDLKLGGKKPRSDYRISEDFYDNIIVDKNTLMSYTLNTSFKNYIDSFKDKGEFHFITTINYDNIITLEIDFENSKYKLQKFKL